MPDFRVTDRRATDLRLREAGPAAAGVWMLSGSWSTGAGTDGWVPAHYVHSWPAGAAAAKKLCTVGLWTPHRLGTQDGYLFDQQEWTGEQRLAVDVERDRQLAADRARRSRRGRKDRELADSGQLTTGLVSVTRDVTRDAHRTSPPNVTAHVTPMRHGERALLPHPHPLPRERPGEEGDGSERAADPPAAPPAPHDLPDLEPHGDDPARSDAPRTDRRPRPLPMLSHAHLAVLSRRELDGLDPRCDRHAHAPPGTPTPSCRDCGLRRVAIAEAIVVLEQRDRDELELRRGAASRRAADCACCDEHGWVIDPDPSSPARRCEHLSTTQPERPHAAGGTR